jgi:nucleoid-associated protein YgaU
MSKLYPDHAARHAPREELPHERGNRQHEPEHSDTDRKPLKRGYPRYLLLQRHRPTLSVRAELQALDRLKVPAVVAQNGEVVAEAGGCNQEIEISYHPAFLAQSPSFSAEDLACFLIHGYQLDLKKKILQGFLIACRIGGVEHPFVKLGQRDDADAKTVTVEEGETLSTVAERVYGRADMWERIYEANRDRISDPDHVPAGTRLIIPEEPRR